jgi:hypothetical protein
MATETMWGEEVRDPLEILDEIEHEIILALNINLAGQPADAPMYHVPPTRRYK